MSVLTVWQTDDCCPACGSLLRARTQPDGRLAHECGCGWQATWPADVDEEDR